MSTNPGWMVDEYVPIDDRRIEVHEPGRSVADDRHTTIRPPRCRQFRIRDRDDG